MGWLRWRERGFTLLELMGVLAILVVLVVAVVIAVAGFSGRGGRESYDADAGTIQMAVATFYTDKRLYDPLKGWNEPRSTASPDYYFPTQTGHFSDIYAGDAVYVDGQSVYWLMEANDGSLADAEDIYNAAIWFGLMVNAPGSGTGVAPMPDTRENSAPLAGEGGLYLTGVPQSCSIYNYPKAKGSYTWIVGKDGKIYGAFQVDCVWYAGFSGSYP